MKNTFTNDLAKAKHYEELVMNKFAAKGYTVTAAPDKYFPDYDFIVADEHFSNKVELKVDYMSAFTGNICVEYSKNNGSPSGVTAGNKNDYIMYLLPDKTETTFRYFIIKKRLLFSIASKYKKFITPCKDNNGFCMIVSLEHLDKYLKDTSFTTPTTTC